MRTCTIVVPFVFGLLALVGCQRSDEPRVTPVGSGSGSGSAGENRARKSPAVEPIKPPLDVKITPLDAIKTSSGLVYKKLFALEVGDAPKRNDTVQIVYTGWRQKTGETFFSNRGTKPMTLPLANTAPGFTEGMQLLKKGEKAMLWLPPSIGYKGEPPPGSQAETLVYEVEIVDIQPAPAIPADLAGPTAAAQKLPSGILAQVVRPGTGKDKPKPWDTVTFNYSAWDQTGRMFDSTEMRKLAATVPPYRQSRAMEEMLTSMLPGSRVRFWVDAKLMHTGDKPSAGMPEGLLVYELELVTVAKGKRPPPAPPDVAAVPAGAPKTEKGVAYRILSGGKGGAKPTANDTVRVHYSGWTTEGRLFDSSLIKGEPAMFSLRGVISGWTEGIPMMSVGDRARFWIPEELAYAGAPGKPQGTLVFDVELLEIKPAAPPAAEAPDPHAPKGASAKRPVPADVAKPPADAKKSPLGVFYKILKPVPNAPRPTADSRVKVHYTGWQTDGNEFDSSHNRGQPIEFSLRGVIKGWTDALPLMGVGEEARLWVPEELAYPGGGGPHGMLVFDIDLLEIK